MTVRELMEDVLKMVFGTDASCGLPEAQAKTEQLAQEAEQHIHSMNRASARLARLQPARNLEEAIEQIQHRARG